MSSGSLALAYRPHTFHDVIGQKSVSLILSQMVLKNTLPNSIILTGTRGSGKTSTARVLAASLNCEIQPDPCGTCYSCKSVFDGSSLDVSEMDAASNGLVADIRILREQVMYSVGGSNRVVILDEVQMMSREAFNALLKILEEPPANTTFILITTEPSKIPDTILSRCMEFVFSPIAVKDIVERLQYICEQEDLTVDHSLLTAIAEYARGGMRDAVMVLDQVTRVGVRTADNFRELFGLTDFAPCILSALINQDMPALFTCVDTQMQRTGDARAISKALIELLTDLLRMKSEGPVGHAGSALERREELSRSIDTGSVVQILKVLWALRTEIHTGVDKSDLDLALVMISEVIAKTKPVIPPRTLSLQEMRSMAGA